MTLSKDAETNTEIARWDLPEITDVSGRYVHSEDVYTEAIEVPTAAQIEQLREQTKAEAYQEGFAEGHAAGYQESMAVAARLRELLAVLDQPFEDLSEQVEQELVTLAVVIAQQLVRREIRVDEKQIIAVIREALQILPAAARNVKARLNPEDAALVREMLASAEGDEHWSLVEDPLVTKGGCIIVTDVSRVDASVENRLAAIAATVLGGAREGDSG